MRRKDRAATLLEDAEPWDLIVLDEAHHARRRAAGSRLEGGPNSLLKLMRALKARHPGIGPLDSNADAGASGRGLGLARPARAAAGMDGGERSSSSSRRSTSQVRRRKRWIGWPGYSKPSNATTGRCHATPSRT